MIKLIIIFGFLFVAGNVVWPLFNEPKFFYVPLAIFISLMVKYIHGNLKFGYPKLFMQYLFILSLGNVIKQLFYNEQIKQLNDYVFGFIVTAWLFYQIGKLKVYERFSK